MTQNDSLFAPPPLAEAERMVEAILFASAEPMTLADISARLPHGADGGEAIAALRRRYDGRGVQLLKVGDAYAFRTAPDLGHLMHQERVEARKLSRAAIETLAIVAYHQPATRAEIEEIRGVAVSRGTVDQLIELEWIRFGRRRMTPGRPVTFVVTDQFLDHFGLESARDLPGLKELRAAGLLDNRPGFATSPRKMMKTKAPKARANFLRIEPMQRIINMIINQIFRRLVKVGIAKGMEQFAGKGETANRGQGKTARSVAKRARQAARLTRRLGR